MNTSLPASAVCERLFSYARQIFTPKRINVYGIISDINFENLLLLKIEIEQKI